MPTLYAARGGSSASNLYTVNPSTGVMTSVGPTGYAITGLAVDPTTGTLYAVTSNNSPIHARALITLNKATGAATYIGQLGLSSPIVDIAFKSDGTLYGPDNSVGLYSINKATGAATALDGGGPGGFGGNGFEIDAADKGYVFDGGLGNLFHEFYDLSVGAASLLSIGTLTNPNPMVFGSNPVAGASFDASGVMWGAVNDGGGTRNTFVTIAPDGTVAVVGSIGSALTNLDALAWDGGVKPDPWFAAVDLVSSLFNTAPVPGADNCSTPGAMVSTDGASEGPSSLKVDAATADSWVEFDYTHQPDDFQWTYTSFALYIPSWADIWDGGTAWAPCVVALDPSVCNNPGFFLHPTSPTTGVLRLAAAGTADSPPIPDGQWVAVEAAYTKRGSGFTFSGRQGVRYWINNIDGGEHTGSSIGPTPGDGVTLGDSNWGGPPPTDANVTYYLDDFHLAFARIGPVDLSAAFFNGVGSGTDQDACHPTNPHPVDDFYSVFQGHTLNVAAPGVMSNDIFPTTVSLNTGPAHGSLILNSDGSFSYTPDPSFVGVDAWVYNGKGGTATVTITISARNPTAVFDGAPGFKVAA